MTKKRHPVWQFDFAGRHGTAWGTFNAGLTTVTVTTVAHFATDMALLVVGVGVGVAVVATLARAALIRRRIPAATVLYQLMCWAGAGGWSLWMLGTPDWNLSMFGERIALLSGLVVGAGILVGLASERGEDEETEADVEAEPAPLPSDPEEAARVEVALEWEDRIERICGFKVTVGAVEDWERGNGYTIAGRLPEGGILLDALRGKAPNLAADKDLPVGCQVVPYGKPGGGRRDFLMDVATVNALADDQPYPAEITQLSINDELPFGVRPNFDDEFVEMRSKCLLAVGEPGSGKTNFGHDLTGGFVRTVDSIVMQIDLTGAGLARPWLRPWLEGRTNRPAVNALADTPEKAMQMLRALLRIGYARKSGYGDLMAQVDDDKLPIGHILPDGNILSEVILMVDEIAKITGTRSEWPDLRDMIVQVINELRASGVRVVLLGLRATDDVVVSSIQAMCAIKVGLKMTTKAEMSYLFGWSDGIAPEDAPYPGCGFIQHDSATKPRPFRAWRLTPSVIDRIAVAADEWIPELDPLSRAAANGRNLDGTLMKGVPESDIDWYEHRWDGWERTGNEPLRVAMPKPAIPPVPPLGTSSVAVADVMQAAEQAQRELEARIAEARGDDPSVRPEFERVLAEAGWDEDAKDFNDPGTWSRPPEEPDTPVTDDDMTVMLAILGTNGAAGMGPKELREKLAAKGKKMSRDKLHNLLNAALRDDKVHQPGYGKWAAGPKP